MTPARLRGLLLLLEAILLAGIGCGEGPQEPAAVPGVLGLRITSGSPRNGAVLAVITAREGETVSHRVTLHRGVREFSAAVSDREVRLFLAGGLRVGELSALNVSDVSDSTAYQVSILEIADSTGVLLPVSTFGFALVPWGR